MTVLRTEVQGFNELTRLVRSSMQRVQDAASGLLPLDLELQEIFNSMCAFSHVAPC